MSHPFGSRLLHLLTAEPKRVAASLRRRLGARESAALGARRAFHPDGETVALTRRTLERILTENIVPFWYPEVVDEKDGGYRLNHDESGAWRGPSSKYLVTQARTLWFFSRLAASRFGGAGHLEAARHGYEFLRARMRDGEFGGFYWEVDSSGRAAASGEKRIYGQAFALSALAEYARVSGDASAAAAAGELFDLLETKAHDARHGGYRDILQRDWSAPAALAPKRMNTHLHLLEGLTAFAAGGGAPRARARLAELIFIQSDTVVRKEAGACTEQFLEDWRPLRGRTYDRVSYGHDLENIWLLARASVALEFSPAVFLGLFRALFDNALGFGFDRTGGGFYNAGRLNAGADRREKIWWVQAEALVAALEMHRLTGEEIYWRCFLRMLEWIERRQIDWERGDWHHTIEAGGRISGMKAGEWKCPYHQGRAMLECLDRLAAL